MTDLSNLTDEQRHELFLKASTANLGNRFEEDERRGRRDPITGRLVYHPDFGANDQNQVTFSVQPVLSKLETYLAQGVPKYVDMEFITIVVPGNRDLTQHCPVTDFYIWQYPNEYKAFKQGIGQKIVGTPLSLWPVLTPSQIKELEYHGVHTVEQLANLSDSVSGVLRGFHSLKAKAKEFLEDARDVAKNALLKQQLEEQQEAHNAQMAEMNAKFEALMKVVEANAAQPKPTKKAAADDK